MSGWSVCPECKGRGKKSRRITKKSRLHYQQALNQFENKIAESKTKVHAMRHAFGCKNCLGTGLLKATKNSLADTETYPHVAIIGAGIGGVALAVACLHRGIPFTLYERDNSFNARSQGYGLTLQQASKAIAGFGILALSEAVVSTRHIVHNTAGKVIGEWGMRKWLPSNAKYSRKHTNMHIARQALRLALIKQLGGHDAIQWGHQLVAYKEYEGQGVVLSFEVDGKINDTKADLIVGADGIRSTVRKYLVGEDTTPLRYLGCIVILGICPLAAIKLNDDKLLDAATVFQTVNGLERIYIMPYSTDSVMWQLSFPMPEKEALELSTKGHEALKEEACSRAHWHDPIPQILLATNPTLISGYPVYDRTLLDSALTAKWGKVTLIGDAAHPMSPFKGQGANQALLDALSLARRLYINCGPLSQWRQRGIRKSVLTQFESEMFERSAVKVKDSAAVAQFLHSEAALIESDSPRGSILKRK